MKGYRILAQDCLASNDSWATGLNRNDIIIGPSGSGKTRGYVVPNLLQGNESFIVADPKGSLHGMLGGILESQGYKVYNIDFTDCGTGSGYNPLDYVRCDPERGRYNEQDIMTVAAVLVPVESQEPFWDLSARMRLESLISYVLECLPNEEHDLATVSKLFQSGKADLLIRELEQMAPDSFAVMRHKLSDMGRQAERMTASIMGILAERLACCNFEGARRMFKNPEKVYIPNMGREKTALFLTVSDTDRSMDRLVNLFFTQALHALCDAADHSPSHRLQVPVRFILDDFASGTLIPDFDGLISVIRSREISVSVIIQSLTQLESLYGRARAATILANADHTLFLGSQDLDTAAYISQRANRPVSAILKMPLDDAMLFVRGQPPRQVKKFDLTSHPQYHRLPEAQPQPEAQP